MADSAFISSGLLEPASPRSEARPRSCGAAAKPLGRGGQGVHASPCTSGVPRGAGCGAALRSALSFEELPEDCGSMSMGTDTMHSQSSFFDDSSEQSHSDALCCEEGQLGDDDEPREEASWQPAAARNSSASSRPSPPCSFDASFDVEVVENELRRESALRPGSSGAKRIGGDTRATAVSWMVEVACGVGLQQETLFAAVSHMDRFLCQTEIVPPTKMLQLLALACVSLAAKQEEVPQYHIDHWLQLAVDGERQLLFRREDLQKMEWLVLETLEWRLRAPTTHSFLQHFLNILSNLGSGVVPDEGPQRQTFVSCSHFLTELSLLYDGFLQYPSSTIAVAALVLSEWTAKGTVATGSGAAPVLHTAPALQAVLPLDLHDLRPCVEALHELYTRATSAPLELLGVVAPVVARYTSGPSSDGPQQ